MNTECIRARVALSTKRVDETRRDLLHRALTLQALAHAAPDDSAESRCLFATAGDMLRAVTSLEAIGTDLELIENYL